MTSSKDFLRSRLRLRAQESEKSAAIYRERKNTRRKRKKHKFFSGEEKQVSVVKYTEDKLEASKYSH